jgi:protein SCO1/2
MTKSVRLLAVLAAVAAGGALLAGTALLFYPREIPRPAAVGGPFQLTDQSGRRVTEQDFKGQVTLVFFGFTHCPDICPTTLFEISEILKRLGPDAGKVAALFVTVDPERDTADKLKDYLGNFHPRISGLTGTPAEIDAVVKTYRAYAKKVPLDGGGYTMDHSAVVYLMDQQGRFVAPFNLRRTAEEAAADLRRRL